jgi:hypothetical protein
LGIKFNPLIFDELQFSGGGTGDVVGPASATDNAIARFDGTTGKLIQNSGGSIDDSGNITANNLSGTNTGDVTLTAVGAVPNANGASLSGQALTLQPADGTNPGLITSGTQTIGGAKTFSANVTTSSSLFADGGIDTSAAGTLSIGSTNATIINLGNASATVNFNGTVNNNNVTNLNVADQLITINDGGGAGSASGAGIEIEEASVITGYIKTSADRNSYELLAPNTAGIVTVTPGVSGFTINQGSHNPVTIGSFGVTPNANGLSLSTQALSLQPADGTNPGAVSTSAQTIAGVKTFLSAPNLDSLTASLPLKLDASKNILAQAINLSGSEVSNTLPVARGGTNSSTALNNDRIIVSSSGSIVEAAALTDGQLLIGSTGVAPVAANVSAGTGITVTNGAGSISIATTITQYTNEDAQDAVGSILTDTATIDLVYNDGANTITANVVAGSIGNTELGTGIDVSQFADGSVSDTEFQFINSLSSNAQDQLDNKQPLDATLTALAAYNTNGILTQTAADTFTGRTITAGAGISITNGNGVAGNPTITNSFTSTGDIPQTSFSAANNQAVAADVTGLAFANASIRAFKAIVSVTIDATTDLFEVFELLGVQKGSSWDMSKVSTGDDSGVEFSISGAGQVTYTSSNISGFVSSTIKFRAEVLGV